MLNGDVVEVLRNVREYGEPCFSGDIVTGLPNSDRTGQAMTYHADSRDTDKTSAFPQIGPYGTMGIDMLNVTETRPNLHHVFVFYGDRTFLGIYDIGTRLVHFRTEDDIWLGSIKSAEVMAVRFKNRKPLRVYIKPQDVRIRTISDMLDVALCFASNRPQSSLLGRGGMMWDETDRTRTLDALVIAEYFANNPAIR